MNLLFAIALGLPFAEADEAPHTRLLESMLRSPDCTFRITRSQSAEVGDSSPVYIVVVTASRGQAGCAKRLELMVDRAETLGIAIVVEDRRPREPPTIVLKKYDLIHEVVTEEIDEE